MEGTRFYQWACVLDDYLSPYMKRGGELKLMWDLDLCIHKYNICKWKGIFLCHEKVITNIVIGEDEHGAQNSLK